MTKLDARREQMLAEMGIKPRWQLRDAPAEAAVAIEAPAPEPIVQPKPAPLRQPEPIPVMASDEPPAWLDDAPPPFDDMPVGDAMPMDRSEPAVDAEPASRSAPAVAKVNPVSTMDWDALEAAVRDCRACRLCEARKQTVFGVGAREAEWMIVGEGPGAEEDERGEPFVGQAGRLLDAMLDSVGLSRQNTVYIANAVKCRPPGNRTPQPDEMAACRPFLERQIELVAPRLLIAMGRPAAQTLLGGEPRISASRGKVFRYESVPVVVTYHPAYLLRNLPDKSKAWEDLCFAQDEMARQKEKA